jgi:hypothetical protein
MPGKLPNWKVSEYTLYASNGRRIRQATQVDTGPSHAHKMIRFLEKVPKNKALREAVKIVSRWRE